MTKHLLLFTLSHRHNAIKKLNATRDSGLPVKNCSISRLFCRRIAGQLLIRLPHTADSVFDQYYGPRRDAQAAVADPCRSIQPAASGSCSSRRKLSPGRSPLTNTPLAATRPRTIKTVEKTSKVMARRPSQRMSGMECIIHSCDTHC